MRTLFLTLLLFLPLSHILAVAEAPAEFMTRWVKTYNQNDAKLITAFYDESEDVDCLVSVGLWVRGYDAISKMYREDMAAVRFHDSKAEKMRSRIEGNTALVSFIHRFKYEIRETGDVYRIHIRTTATLLKDGESWKIIGEHSSPINGIERAVLVEE